MLPIGKPHPNGSPQIRNLGLERRVMNDFLGSESVVSLLIGVYNLGCAQKLNSKKLENRSNKQNVKTF